MRREVRQLPSKPVSNPRNQPPGFENAKAIFTLRSGKVLPDPYPPSVGEIPVEKSREAEGDGNIDQFQAKSHDEDPSLDPNPRNK
ncbi:hypothetical protein ACLOJK_018944 [Asimina triloba]